MRIEFDRAAMLDAANVAAAVAPARSPKPILQSLLLEADGDSAALVATDLEVSVRRRVGGVSNLATPGRLVLPAQRFRSILQAGRDARMVAERGGDGLLIRSASAEWRLPSEDPDLFPAVPGFPEGPHLAVQSDVFAQAIRRTMFATDAESTRYALGGVLMELDTSDGPTLALIGTDGRRLARMGEVVALTEGFALPAQPVVPVKALKLIERCLADDESDARLMFSGHSITLDLGAATVWARLVEGRFPRYRDVFPAEACTTIPVDGPMLTDAIAAAAVATSEESRGVDFHFGPGELTLRAKAADVGSSSATVPIDYQGEPIVIAFDPRYLADALKALGDAGGLTLDLIGEKHAAVLRSADGYAYVVMPLTRGG